MTTDPPSNTPNHAPVRVHGTDQPQSERPWQQVQMNPTVTPDQGQHVVPQNGQPQPEQQLQPPRPQQYDLFEHRDRDHSQQPQQPQHPQQETHAAQHQPPPQEPQHQQPNATQPEPEGYPEVVSAGRVLGKRDASYATQMVLRAACKRARLSSHGRNSDLRARLAGAGVKTYADVVSLATAFKSDGPEHEASVTVGKSSAFGSSSAAVTSPTATSAASPPASGRQQVPWTPDEHARLISLVAQPAFRAALQHVRRTAWIRTVAPAFNDPQAVRLERPVPRPEEGVSAAIIAKLDPMKPSPQWRSGDSLRSKWKNICSRYLLCTRKFKKRRETAEAAAKPGAVTRNTANISSNTMAMMPQAASKAAAASSPTAAAAAEKATVAAAIAARASRAAGTETMQCLFTSPDHLSEGVRKIKREGVDTTTDLATLVRAGFPECADRDDVMCYMYCAMYDLPGLPAFSSTLYTNNAKEEQETETYAGEKQTKKAKIASGNPQEHHRVQKENASGTHGPAEVVQEPVYSSYLPPRKSRLARGTERRVSPEQDSTVGIQRDTNKSVDSDPVPVVSPGYPSHRAVSNEQIHQRMQDKQQDDMEIEIENKVSTNGDSNVDVVMCGEDDGANSSLILPTGRRGTPRNQQSSLNLTDAPADEENEKEESRKREDEDMKVIPGSGTGSVNIVERSMGMVNVEGDVIGTAITHAVAPLLSKLDHLCLSLKRGPHTSTPKTEPETGAVMAKSDLATAAASAPTASAAQLVRDLMQLEKDLTTNIAESMRLGDIEHASVLKRRRGTITDKIEQSLS